MHSTSLNTISYPIFRIGVNKPQTDSGVIFHYYEKDTEEGTIASLRIFDDINLPQQSLALRRLYLITQGAKLAKIGQAIFFLGDLIKLATPNTWFIDSAGKMFNYEKSTRAKLQFYEISKNIPINTGGSIIEAKGIITRFKSLYSPSPYQKYVGLLHFGKSLILYGFYEEKPEDTWRLV